MIYGRDYQRSPICEIDTAEVESTSQCLALGVHNCDGRQVCDSHGCQCPWCHAFMCLQCYALHECDAKPTEEDFIEMERRLC